MSLNVKLAKPPGFLLPALSPVEGLPACP